jgi:pimeloyl-ACP methyl ester carboxylesterase
MIKGDPTFLLVHGSWHIGDCWSAVAAHLREAGFSVATPTLAGHGTDCDRDVTHDDYVHSVVAALDRLPGEIVLVGHSFGGSVISRVAELRPDRCRLLVYYSAFVPLDGERVADSLPEPLLAFLEESAAATLDRSVTLPLDLFTGAFANTTDPDTAAALYERLVPEPAAPIFEPLSLPCFPELEIPSAYISCARDLALPPGSFQPGQSSRLDAPRLIEIDADHEALLTAPRRLAWALLEAVRPDTHRQSVAA